jgi:hypothetical protein
MAAIFKFENSNVEPSTTRNPMSEFAQLSGKLQEAKKEQEFNNWQIKKPGLP